MQTPTGHLAHFAATLSFDTIPDHVLRKTEDLSGWRHSAAVRQRPK